MSRELCLKIKENLEKSFYKIWIDVNEIHGSSLDSMAKAVESSEYILICITERYRQSLYCQAEAQYAFRLNKKIIPLIMQKGYHQVDGWLGIIIGDKIFVDFSKYELEDCVNRLKKQLTLLQASSNQSSANPANFATVSSPSNIRPITPKNDIPINIPAAISAMLPNLAPENSTNVHLLDSSESNSKYVPQLKNTVKNWSDSETAHWFKENELEDLFNNLKPVNGKILFEFYQLQMYTPQYYYTTLTNNKNNDIKQVAKFGGLLRDLFGS